MDPITIFICFVVLAVIINVIAAIFNPSGSGHSGGATASHKSSLHQPQHQPLRRSMASRMNRPGDPMYMNNLNNPNNPASLQWQRLHQPHRPKH